MDNASNYVAEEVTSRLEHLGIRVVHPPAGLAEMRARVERVFGTLKTQIVQFFSGQTFSNILEKGNYDAQGNASINVQQLNRLFLVGVLDLYHHHPHEGLVGDTPYNCMLRLSSEYGVPPPPDRDVVRHVMGTTCERRIGEEGIRFLGIRYQSPAVQMLRREVRQRPVEIRVDRWDLSSISVRVKGDGWITVDARFKGLENVSVWRWAETVRDLQMRNQHLAKQSRHLVDQAIRTLSDAAAAAVERAEIENPVVTSETFERLERTIFRSFSFDDDGEYGEDLELPTATRTDPDSGVQPNFENDPETSSAAQPKTSSAAAQPKKFYPDDDRGFGSIDEWSSN